MVFTPFYRVFSRDLDAIRAGPNLVSWTSTFEYLCGTFRLASGSRISQPRPRWLFISRPVDLHISTIPQWT